MKYTANQIRTFKRIEKEAKQKNKAESCYLCGEPKSSFCNSHTIPKMVLKNISDKGMMMSFESVVYNELNNSRKGINQAGVFHLICNSCDSITFKDYENYDNLTIVFTNRMMAEIALKNHLKFIYKHSLSKHIELILQKKYNSTVNHNVKVIIENLNIRDNERGARIAKKIIDNNLKSGYKMLYWTILEYVTPIAAQIPLALRKDIEGYTINDAYDLSANLYMQILHLCVFPLDGKTVIALFRHKDENRYYRFEKQFNRFNNDEKLEFINKTIFLESEDFYMSPSLYKFTKDNDNLKRVAKQVEGIEDFGVISNLSDIKYLPNDLEIPNFLSYDYRVI